MRTLLILSFLALSFGAEACMGQERKVLMPEQVEDDRPQGDVTVAFRVVDVGLVKGPIKAGQSPYPPITLQAAQLRDRRNKLYVVLGGKAPTQVHQLGIDDPVKHFRGRTVEASGKVRYITLNQIMPDGKENPGDPYTHYEMVIDNLDHFRVAPQAKEKQQVEFDRRILDGVKFGYLFPTFGDFDGDGKIDMLVGTDEGRLLVYLNRGTNKAPEYAKPFWFDDVVKGGRIPGG